MLSVEYAQAVFVRLCKAKARSILIDCAAIDSKRGPSGPPNLENAHAVLELSIGMNDVIVAREAADIA